MISIYNSGYFWERHGLTQIFCCNFYRFLKGLKSGVVDGVEKLMRDCAASEPLRRKSSFSHSHIFFFFAYLAIVAALFAQKIQKPQKMINVEKYYDVQISDENLREKFVQLDLDEGTNDFIKW